MVSELGEESEENEENILMTGVSYCKVGGCAPVARKVDAFPRVSILGSVIVTYGKILGNLVVRAI